MLLLINFRTEVAEFILLHGPPMLVDKTTFGLVLCNHANFYLLIGQLSEY